MKLIYVDMLNAVHRSKFTTMYPKATGMTEEFSEMVFDDTSGNVLTGIYKGQTELHVSESRLKNDIISVDGKMSIRTNDITSIADFKK